MGLEIGDSKRRLGSSAPPPGYLSFGRQNLLGNYLTSFKGRHHMPYSSPQEIFQEIEKQGIQWPHMDQDKAAVSPSFFSFLHFPVSYFSR